MSQHRTNGNITDTLDVLHRGRVLIVNLNAAARVLLNTSSLKIETIRVGTTTNSNKNNIGL